MIDWINMKKSNKKIITFTTTAITTILVGLSTSAIANTEVDKVIQDLVNKTIDAGKVLLYKDAPDWLTRTEISIDMQENFHPSWTIETIQPIKETELDTYFWQGRFSHDRTPSDVGNIRDETYNLGVGYRHLLPNKEWMFGVNAFYDYTHEHSHRRVGLGGEVFNQYGTFRVNGYEGISDKRTLSDSSTEKAVNGWDAALEAPIPKLPWVNINLKTSEFDRAASKNVKTETYSLRANLTDNIEVEMGTTNNNASDSENFGKFIWHIGKPKYVTSTMADGTQTTRRNLENHRLEKVRRHNNIVIDNGTAGLTVGRKQ
jgi:hypothetical protein